MFHLVFALGLVSFPGSACLLFRADLVMLCSGEGHKLVWLRCRALHSPCTFQETRGGLAVVPIPISIYIKQPHLDTGPGDVCGSAGVRSGPFNPANVHTTTDNNKLLDGWVWVQHAASPEITALSCGGMDGWKLKREAEARLEIVTDDRDRWEMEGVRKRIGKLN